MPPAHQPPGRINITCTIPAPTFRVRASITSQPAVRAAKRITIYGCRINGTAGDVVTVHGSVCAVIGFTVVNGKIAALGVFAGPERLRLPGVEVLN